MNIINSFHIVHGMCDWVQEIFSSSLRHELLSLDIDVVTMTVGHCVLPARYIESHIASTRRYIRPNGRWNKQIETGMQLVRDYSQPVSAGGCGVPLHHFCEVLYIAIHAVYPKRRYICNISLAMRLGGILPEFINQFLHHKFFSLRANVDLMDSLKRKQTKISRWI